jgi:hypothetical protein
MPKHGYLFPKGSSWFLRFRNDENIDGQIVRKQKFVKLAITQTATAAPKI